MSILVTLPPLRTLCVTFRVRVCLALGGYLPCVPPPRCPVRTPGVPPLSYPISLSSFKLYSPRLTVVYLFMVLTHQPPSLPPPGPPYLVLSPLALPLLRLLYLSYLPAA